MSFHYKRWSCFYKLKSCNRMFRKKRHYSYIYIKSTINRYTNKINTIYWIVSVSPRVRKLYFYLEMGNQYYWHIRVWFSEIDFNNWSNLNKGHMGSIMICAGNVSLNTLTVRFIIEDWFLWMLTSVFLFLITP